MRTVWLLDVDGVVNATRPGWSAPPRSAMAYADGQGYRLRWEPKLIAAIHRVGKLADVDIVWATTWCDHVDQLERVFGLDLPVAFGPRPAHLTYDEQKVDAARQVLARGDRLIWTDDNVVPAARGAHREFALAEADGRALLIAPKPSRGLRPEDVERIEAFAGHDCDPCPAELCLVYSQ